MKKSVFLKVVSILLILEGVVNMLLALGEAFGSLFFAENGGLFPHVPLIIALVAMSIVGTVSVICGAYGDTNWKNPKNMRVCLIWGAILLLGLIAFNVYTWFVLPTFNNLALITLIIPRLNGIALCNLVLPILYIIAAAKFRDTSKE